MEAGACVVAIFAATSLWYGARMGFAVASWARAGILNIPALVVAAVELWTGGLFAFAGGTLSRRVPALPDRLTIMLWTAAVFTLVGAVVISRRPDVEARLSPRLRKRLGGRFVLAGVVAATVVLAVTGFLTSW